MRRSFFFFSFLLVLLFTPVATAGPIQTIGDPGHHWSDPVGPGYEGDVDLDADTDSDTDSDSDVDSDTDSDSDSDTDGDDWPWFDSDGWDSTPCPWFLDCPGL